LKQRINRLLPTIAAYVDGFSYHLCDIVIAAYTAFLHYEGKNELYGEPDESAIYLPFLDKGGLY